MPLLTGYAEWWDLLLIFGGLALVAFEIFVFPGHMVSAVVGTLMVLVGLLLTFVGNAWSVPGTWQHAGHLDQPARTACTSSPAAWSARSCCRCGCGATCRKLPYFNRLILTATSGGQIAPPGRLEKSGLDAAGVAVPDFTPGGTPGGTPAHPDRHDRWPFLGTVGRAVSDLKPGGSAEFPYADDTRTTAVDQRERLRHRRDETDRPGGQREPGRGETG